MAVKIPLKNRTEVFAVVDDHVFKTLNEDKELSSKGLLPNLRAHQSGYPFFQKYVRTNGESVFNTIYLHKLIAERFIPRPKSDKKLFVRFKDGDVLNVRLENLEWVTMNTLRRQMKGSKGALGYRGVTTDRGRYRAMIFNGKKSYDLGFFKTPEEAALAYNAKSRELFGETPSLNEIPLKKK